MSVWEWLAAHLLPDHQHPPRVPPPAPPPSVTVTPQAERRAVDRRLSDQEARLAELATIAGLDELRRRAKGKPGAAE